MECMGCHRTLERLGNVSRVLSIENTGYHVYVVAVHAVVNGRHFHL